MPGIKIFFDNVADFEFKYWWLVIVAMLIHRLPFFLFEPDEGIPLKKLAMILSFLLLIFALIRNWNTSGFRIVLAGVMLNFLAIVFNGGLMPVSPDARISAGMTSIVPGGVGGVLPEGSGILLLADQTRLWILTDIIPIERIGAVCSIGDIIIIVGMFFIGIQIILYAYRKTTDTIDPHTISENVPEGRA